MPRFRFSIRDLLWLTLVVAVGLGWFVREQGWLAREQQLQAQVDKAAHEADLYEERHNLMLQLAEQAIERAKRQE